MHSIMLQKLEPGDALVGHGQHLHNCMSGDCRMQGIGLMHAFGSEAGGAGDEPGAAGGGGGGIQYVYRLAGAVDGAVSWFT
jgi:hypothetical protein